MATMAELTGPGWHPDPWGTDDERYFDGRAWTRQVRAPGTDAPRPDAPSPVAGEAPAPEPAAGWFPDPRREAQWRWWDGTQWTGHTERTVSERSVVAELETERTWARWARVGLALNPVFQVLALVGAAIQARWIAEHLDDLPATGGPDLAGALGWFGLPTWAVLVVMILWLYRAGATARAAGLSLRRDAGLGAVSFVIPVLNLWWPYRAVRDALGADHPAARLVRRWWAVWIASNLGGLAAIAAGFAPPAASFVVVSVAGVCAVVAAVMGRAVVAEMLAAHETLAARAATGAA
jgi:hypothetical protein